MDDCTNCEYLNYCKYHFQYVSINPCNLILPDQIKLLNKIDEFMKNK